MLESTSSGPNGKAGPQGHRWESSDASECRLVAKEIALLVYSFKRAGWKRE